MNVRLIGLELLYSISNTGASIPSKNLEKIANLSTAIKEWHDATPPVKIRGSIDLFYEDFARDQENVQLYYLVRMDCFRDCKPILPGIIGSEKEKAEENLAVSKCETEGKKIILEKAEELVKRAGLPDRISNSMEKFDRTLVKRIWPYLEKAGLEVDNSRSDYYRIVERGKAAFPLKL